MRDPGCCELVAAEAACHLRNCHTLIEHNLYGEVQRARGDNPVSDKCSLPKFADRRWMKHSALEKFFVWPLLSTNVHVACCLATLWSESRDGVVCC